MGLFDFLFGGGGSNFYKACKDYSSEIIVSTFVVTM